MGSSLGQEKSFIASAQAMFIRTDKSGMHNGIFYVLKHCAFYDSKSCKITIIAFDDIDNE